MISENEVIRQFVNLQQETLHVWIDRGWVIPKRSRGRYQFREIDIARVGLIYEFSTELALDDETLGVILPLLDQVHGLRNQLRRLADAISAQPPDVRQSIAKAFAETESQG